MIDDKKMLWMLESMEHAAEEALRHDAAFCDALQSLKAEIDCDTRVQSAVRNLHEAGSRVFSSLVPRIKIRIRTNEGVVALPERNPVLPVLEEPVAQLSQELKSAASAVIMRGRYRQELDSIMNEAICASLRFEGIASHIESAGYEIVICLDLSTYAQLRHFSAPIRNARHSCGAREPFCGLLSGQDMKFLKAIGISPVGT
jgi:hypothetical protein